MKRIAIVFVFVLSSLLCFSQTKNGSIVIDTTIGQKHIIGYLQEYTFNYADSTYEMKVVRYMDDGDDATRAMYILSGSLTDCPFKPTQNKHTEAKAVAKDAINWKRGTIKSK